MHLTDKSESPPPARRRFRWTFGRKIGALAAVLLTFQALVAVITFVNLRELNYEIHETAAHDIPAFQAALDVELARSEMQSAALSMRDGSVGPLAIESMREAMRRGMADLEAIRSIAARGIEAAASISEEEAQEAQLEYPLLLDLVGRTEAIYRELGASIEALNATGPDQSDWAAACHRVNLTSTQTQHLIQELTTQAARFPQESAKQSESIVQTATAVLVIGAALAMTVGLAASIIIIRRLSSSIAALSNTTTTVARSLAEGAFTPTFIDIKPGDEIGQAAAAVNRLIQCLDQNIMNYRNAEAAKRAAEITGRFRSEFLANMSHEIRTPMTAILGYADLLQDPTQTEDGRKQCIETIRRNGEHLLSIINDILDISKIDAGRMLMQQTLCSPCQIIAEVAALMRVRAAGKNLPLDVEYVFPVPEHVQSDPIRLRQILLNLVGNAIKFTEKGQVKIIVRSDGVNDEKPHINFEIIDTGIGMTAAQRALLFQPFQQVDSSTTRRFGGTGLGLSISQRLVELLGGRIEVKSEPGVGSTFTLIVPTGDLKGVRMIDSAHEAVLPSASTLEAAKKLPPLDGRILLAEDGLDNQRLISFLLRKAGATVEIAENGRIAIEKAQSAWESGQSYDLIFMDIQMPVLDGHAATRELRKRGYDGAIVALTAHAMAGDREKCLKAGCDDYATKPIDRTVLLQTAHRFLDGVAGVIDRAIGAVAKVN